MCSIDLYRTANLLIQHHGSAAKEHAMQRVLDMREVGDDKGEMVWMGVFEAVLVLQSTRPAAGQTTH